MDLWNDAFGFGFGWGMRWMVLVFGRAELLELCEAFDVINPS